MPSFAVTGMSCDHCVRAVTAAVHAVDPQAVVAVDVRGGRVEVSGTGADSGTLAAAIAEEGYEVTPLHG